MLYLSPISFLTFFKKLLFSGKVETVFATLVKSSTETLVLNVDNILSFLTLLKPFHS